MLRSSPSYGKRLVTGAALASSVFALFACSAILGDFEVEPASSADTGAPTSDTGSSGSNDGNVTADTSTLPDGGGEDADAAKPKTYCDDFVPPVGADQFFCADFDSLVLGKGWDNAQRSDGGTLEKSSDLFVSAPNSMLTAAVGGPADGYFVWKRAGAKAFDQAIARFKINPGQIGGLSAPTETLLQLAEIRTSNALVAFGYSRGATGFQDAPSSSTQHFGYYVSNAAFGGAAILQKFRITQALPPNVWTGVDITWEKDGKINVSYNNLSVFAKAGFPSNDTVVTFNIGAQLGTNGGVMPPHHMDNVELSIRRIN